MMGCDIHAFIEYSNETPEYWECFASPYIGRYYALFSLLAGTRLRDGFEPIYPPRGVPVNMDIWTSHEYEEWGSDAHHASWLTAKEFNHVLSEFKERAGFAQGVNPKGLPVELETIGVLMSYFEERGAKARFIFWFDN